MWGKALPRSLGQPDRASRLTLAARAVTAITLRPVNEAEEIEELGAMADEVRITRVHPPAPSLPARSQTNAIPARAAAAAAAGSFVAGAAVVGLLGRHHRRSALAAKRRPRRRGRRVKAARRSPSMVERLQIVGSRSFVVDVHLLGSPGADR